MDSLTFHTPDLGSTFAFGFLCLALLAATISAAIATRKRLDLGPGPLKMGLVLLAWISFISVLVISGFVAQQPMPRLLVAFGMVILAGMALAFSPWGRALAQGLTLRELVAFQIFRLPLELILHQWAEQGSIPTTMTWTGQNWDIATGAAALLLFPFAERRAVAWAFNILGIALLANVVRVVIFSAPLPFGWDIQPKLVIAFYLPYALIGPICVAGALAGHAVLTRKLLKR